MKRADVREGLERAGFDYESSTPQELGAFLEGAMAVLLKSCFRLLKPMLDFLSAVCVECF